MNFLQNPVGIAENEESIMAYFKKTTVYNEVNSYQVEECLNGWWRVDTLTIGGYPHSTNMLCHFDYGECDLVVLSPTVSFRQSLNLKPHSRYSFEIANPFNVVVFEIDEILEKDILDVLKSRYQKQNLFVAIKGKNSLLIKEECKNVEFGECPYTDFCIVNISEGKLKYIVLSPNDFMLEQEGLI